jgi:hypothetical protein
MESRDYLSEESWRFIPTAKQGSLEESIEH